MAKAAGREKSNGREIDMNDTEENICEQMRMALATYTGPITKCPAGKPRGNAVEFAKRNRTDRHQRRMFGMPLRPHKRTNSGTSREVSFVPTTDLVSDYKLNL
jgi:hypothetical protein